MNNAQIPLRGASGDSAAVALLGDSPRVDALRAAIAKLAATDAPVLITGEIGTGKELAARLIHRQSSRGAGPFVVVNCASMPAGRFQAEVFGSENIGAWPATGGYRRSMGRIQAAQGGTLFLDEIGDLAMDMQTSLLRFLQEGTFERVGSVEPIRADVRVITATHANLEKRCLLGAFREDLYYRLNALHLETPPLREREADTGMLADHFLRELSDQHGAGAGSLRFDHQARQRLLDYPWPGNIRELRNRIMQAVVMCDGDTLTTEHLGLDNHAALSDNGGAKASVSLREKRQVAEREAINQALLECQGQVPAAAAVLGISRAQLYRLIGRLHVNHRPFEPRPGTSPGH